MQGNPVEARLNLRYDGSAVAAGLMPVHEAAANMVAFSEFMVVAVKATYGDQAEAKAEVSGFARGSFNTELVFHIAGIGATLLTVAPNSPKDLFEVIKQAFELWKFLRGAPPDRVDRLNDLVQVTNNNGKILVVRTETLNLVINERGGEAAQGFVRTPLMRDGVEHLSIEAAGGVIARADDTEADYFHPVLADVPVSTNAVRQTVTAESPVFREGLQWRFNDGSTSFSAPIEDREFLASVDQGERFGKGDRLDVEMRIDQIRRGDKYRVDRTIVRVFRHLPASEQRQLFERKE